MRAEAAAGGWGGGSRGHCLPRIPSVLLSLLFLLPSAHGGGGCFPPVSPGSATLLSVAFPDGRGVLWLSASDDVRSAHPAAGAPYVSLHAASVYHDDAGVSVDAWRASALAPLFAGLHNTTGANWTSSTALSFSGSADPARASVLGIAACVRNVGWRLERPADLFVRVLSPAAAADVYAGATVSQLTLNGSSLAATGGGVVSIRPRACGSTFDAAVLNVSAVDDLGRVRSTYLALSFDIGCLAPSGGAAGSSNAPMLVGIVLGALAAALAALLLGRWMSRRQTAATFLNNDALSPAQLEMMSRMLRDFNRERGPSGSVVYGRSAGTAAALNEQVAAEVKRVTILVVQRKILFEDLVIERRLGFGMSAEVLLGSYRNAAVAVKRMLPSQVTAENVDRFKSEMMTMCAVDHPNIIRLIGVCVLPPNLAIVLEHAELGSLDTVLHNDISGRLTWRDPKLSIVLAVARALEYLHNMSPQPFMHRDIKSSNVLLSFTFGARLSDFGEAKRIEDDGDMTVVGTPMYVAPEVMQGEPYGCSCDIYSFGILLAELCAFDCSIKTVFRLGAPAGHAKAAPSGAALSRLICEENWRPDLEALFKQPPVEAAPAQVPRRGSVTNSRRRMSGTAAAAAIAHAFGAHADGEPAPAPAYGAGQRRTTHGVLANIAHLKHIGGAAVSATKSRIASEKQVAPHPEPGSDHAEAAALRRRVSDEELAWPKTFRLNDLISSCWDKDPDARPTADIVVAQLEEIVRAGNDLDRASRAAAAAASAAAFKLPARVVDPALPTTGSKRSSGLTGTIGGSFRAESTFSAVKAKAVRSIGAASAAAIKSLVASVAPTLTPTPSADADVESGARGGGGGGSGDIGIAE